MIKAFSNNVKTELHFNGTTPTICADIADIIQGVVAAIKRDGGEEEAKRFKMVFAKGFMDGTVYGEDRKTMEAYVSEMDKKEAEFEDGQKLENILDKIIGVLKVVRNAMEAEMEAEKPSEEPSVEDMAKEVAKDVKGEDPKPEEPKPEEKGDEKDDATE